MPRTAATNIACPYPGGSLGWKSKGSLDAQFEAVAFDLEASTTANPKYARPKRPTAIISSWSKGGNSRHQNTDATTAVTTRWPGREGDLVSDAF